MHQGGTGELVSRAGMDQDYGGDEDGFDTDGSVKSTGIGCWARLGNKASVPRRPRSATLGVRRGDRRRRDAASNALIRVPGHERRRPYNNFHRFLRVRSTNKRAFIGATKLRESMLYMMCGQTCEG